EFLTEEAVNFLAELLIEIGHHPAAELEPLGRILGRSAGRLHDAVHGNLGADDDFPHVSSLCVVGGGGGSRVCANLNFSKNSDNRIAESSRFAENPRSRYKTGTVVRGWQGWPTTNVRYVPWL